MMGMTLTQIMLWATVFLLSGVVCYLATPVLLGPSLPHHLRQRIGRLYIAQAMAALGRGLLVARKNGSDIDLVASSFDAKHGKEQASLGGEEQRFDDPDESMSRLAKRSFGIANERDGVITTPRDIEIGEWEKRKVEDSEHLFVDESGQEYYNPHVEVPTSERLVKPPTGSAVIGGSADGSAIATIREFVKKAQAGFDEMSMKQAGAIVSAYLMSAGLVWLMVTQGGGGGSVSVSNFGMFIGVMA